MAKSSTNKDLSDGIEVALDASETASKVTQEYNSVKEQFEVVNIHQKKICVYFLFLDHCGGEQLQSSLITFTCSMISWCDSFRPQAGM